MVGRPYPKYTPYESSDSDDEKKSKREDDTDYEKLADENISRERRVIERGKQIRSIDREVKELRHPRYTEGKKSAGRTGSRIVDFAGGLLMEGTKGIRRTRGTSKRRTTRSSTRLGSAGRTGLSEDISLTRAIAMNDWSGEGSSVMERDFFGDDRDRDLIGDRDRRVNIGSDFQKDFFGKKRNQELVGDRDRRVNIGSDFQKDFFGKKKKKQRYY